MKVSACQIRSMHPYSFRSGEWAEVREVVWLPGRGPCYAVVFGDGVEDHWLVDCPHYQFREER